MTTASHRCSPAFFLSLFPLLTLDRREHFTLFTALHLFRMHHVRQVAGTKVGLAEGSGRQVNGVQVNAVKASASEHAIKVRQAKANEASG